MKIIAITPKLFDYIVSTIIEGLYQNNINVIASESANNVRKVYSKKEILQHSKDADYIFVFRGKVKGNIPPKYFLIDKIQRPDITAFIDGSEWNFSGYPGKKQREESLKNPYKRRGKEWINKQMFSYCRWYFKRECYDEDHKQGIIPLLYAAEDRYFGNYAFDKKYDIFCSFGQISSGLRRNVQRVCEKLKKEGFKVVIKKGFKYEEYKKMISKSYITVDAWGGGDCSGRIWEIFANKSCCFSQKYNILFPNGFTDGINYVEYTTIDEFEKKIRFYLNNKNKCLEIAERGYQHLLKYHTSKARARYMLDIIKKEKKEKKNLSQKNNYIGKFFYLNVISISFIKKPRNIFLYLKHLIMELKLRILFFFN